MMIEIGLDGIRLSPRVYREFCTKVRAALKEIETLPYELPDPAVGDGRRPVLN